MLIQICLFTVLESLYDIKKPEIETNWDQRDIETNLQFQSQAFDCTSKKSKTYDIYYVKFLHFITILIGYVGDQEKLKWHINVMRKLSIVKA